MRILQVLSPGWAGGLERVTELLTRGLLHAGDAVGVAVILHDNALEPPWVQSLAQAGASVHCVRVSSRNYLAERRAIASVCAEFRADVLHTHGYRPDILDSSVGKRFGVPIVTTVHGFTGGGARTRVYEWLQRRAWRRFDAVVAVAPSLLRPIAAAGVLASRTHLVPNAWVQTAPFMTRAQALDALGLRDAGMHLGWIGRLSIEKGADVLLHALAMLSDVPCHVSFCGDGPQATELCALAESLGVSNRVSWQGHVADAARLMKAFDAVVLSSRTEGTPMVLLEAMAARVPIVATAVGGVPTMLSNEGALLIEPDDPAALAAAIRSIRDAPEGAALRASRAALRVEKDHSQHRWIRQYRHIYRRIAPTRVPRVAV